MRKTRTLASVSALSAGALLLAGCAGGGGDAGGANGGTFVYGLVEDPGNLNPFLTTANMAREVTGFLYDNLIYIDPETGEPHPWLAESWEESPTEVVYHLKDGITCEDGSELTPEVVANNFNWVTDPENESAINGVLVPADAKATFDDSEGTVTISVEAPSSFLLAQTGSLEIMCQAALDDPTASSAASVGTGLYQLTEAVTGDHYTLTKREGYDWGPEGGNSSDTEGAPQTVEIRVVENVSTAANLLLSGELNAATVTGPDEERVASATDPGRRVSMIQGQWYFSQIEGKPTADPAVRMALAQAVDFEALTQVITDGKGYRAERLAMMAPNPCPYDATAGTVPEHDVAAAEKMLDEAGWIEGADGIRAKDGQQLTLSMLFATSDTMSAAMELAQQQYAEIGVKLELDGGDTNYKLAKLYDEGNAGSFDIADASVNYWLVSVLTPWNSGPLPPGGRNSAGIDNAEYNEKVAAAGQLAGTESCSTWMAAEQALYRAADTIPFAAQDEITYLNGYELALPNVLNGTSIRVKG